MWRLVGLSPAEELFWDETVFDLITDNKRSGGDFVIDAFDFGGLFQDNAAGFVDAVAPDMDFVGEMERYIDNIIHFGAVAVICDGVGDDFNVDITERMIVSVSGL